jgi:predicted secreted protein
MNLVSGSMVFFVIWWVVLFTVLPLGIHREGNPQKGNDLGAPTNPNLKKKFLLTTIITAVIWCIIHFIMVNHLIVLS